MKNCEKSIKKEIKLIKQITFNLFWQVMDKLQENVIYLVKKLKLF